MNKDINNYSRLFYLDQKCLDTLATLIQEQNEANQNITSAIPAGNSSSSLGSTSAKDLKQDDGKNDPQKVNNSFEISDERMEALPGKEFPPSSTCEATVSENLIVVSGISDMRKICPILAALSKEIEAFFKDTPEVLEALQKETTSSTTTATTSFASFQKECLSFLSGYFIDTEPLTSHQKLSWKEITNLLRIITDYPQSQHGIDAEQSLHNLLDVTDRILKKSPRYSNQTAEMSTKDKIILSKGDVFQFMEKIVRTNTAYEAQRLQKSKDIKEPNLEILFEISNTRMENQSYHMDKHKEDQIRAGIFVDLVDKAAKSRLNDQDWVSPKLQKEKDIDIINDKLISSDPVSSIKQVYVICEFKEKEMEISKVVGALEKSPRMTDQESLPKQDLMNARLTDIISTIDKAPKRYDDQTAVRPRRKTEGDHFVHRSNEALVIGQTLPSNESSDTGKNEISQKNAVLGEDSSTMNTTREVVTQKPRRSTISNVINDFGQKASIAFNYNHNPVDKPADNLEQRPVTEGKKLKTMSLGEMLSSAPKSSKSVVMSSDLDPTPSTSNEVLQKSDQNLKTDRNNQPHGFVEKMKSIVKSSSFSNKSELDLTHGSVEQFAKPKPESSSKGFIKSFMNSFSSSKKNSQGELNSTPLGSRSRSKSEIPKSKSAGSKQFLAEVLSENPSSEMSSNKLREITEDAAVQEVKEMPTPRSTNRMALFSKCESTDTIELMESEKSSVSPLKAIQPPSNHKKKESRLRTSINQEELDKQGEEDEISENSKIAKVATSSPKKATRSLTNPQKGEGHGKKSKGNATGFVTAYLNLNPISSSGSTLPDLDKDDYIHEDVPMSEDEKAKSTPASRLPSTEKSFHGSGYVENGESKIFNNLY